MKKKILSLLLAVIMIISIMPTSFAATQFTDSSAINPNYIDAVNKLVELGIISGYSDGSFKPKNNITRAEFAKMVYVLKYGSDTDSHIFAKQNSKFTDVQGNANVAWAKGYINFCYYQGIVSGVGNNKFNPQGNITVAEAAKMILVILGCDPAKEGFTGSDWENNVLVKGIGLGVFNDLPAYPRDFATREFVAKLIGNSLSIPKVLPEFDYNSIKQLSETFVEASDAGVEMLNNINSAMKNISNDTLVWNYSSKAQLEATKIKTAFGSMIKQLQKRAPVELTSGKTLLQFAEEIYDLFEKVTEIEIDIDNASAKLPELYGAAFEASSAASNFGEIVVDLAKTIVG